MVPAEITSHYATNFNKRQTLLAIAVILVQRKDGTFIELRALLDQGSQATFVTEHAVQRLQLRKSKTHAIISGIGSAKGGSVSSSVGLILKPRFPSSYLLQAKAFVMSKLTGLLPITEIQVGNWTHLRNLTLADPCYEKPGHIDIIMGADTFSQIILEGLVKGPVGTPIAQETQFGWILSGETQNKETKKTIQCFVTEVDISRELSKFWEGEELLPERVETSEEIECEMHFRSNHKRESKGRYIVRIPFRINPFTSTELQGSRELALARLFQMERRFKTNKLLETMYKDFMKEYIQLGHMVPTTEDAPVKYYLPHHAVFKHDSTTTKLRVVFDASVKRNSKKSLNEMMMIGPNLQQSLITILTRWQKYKIVFTADIEKMYRQIKVDSRDQDLQRILWRNSPQEPIKEYKLTTVTYGTAAAPYLAIRTLRQLATDDSDQFPIAAKILLKDTYVDDVVSGANNRQEAYEACMQLINLLKGGGFNLRKWNSNDSKLLRHIPSELRDSSNELKFDEGETVKALGIHWDTKSDNFKFKVNIGPDPVIVTKRTILSEAARIFDPIGFLSPVTIKIKLLFQEIWLTGDDWDHAVSDSILEQWSQIKEELPALEKLEIQRWLEYEEDNCVCELHAFSDASEKAYSAAAYIRIIKGGGRVFTRLLAAKTKVAPLRSKLSLPRLELNGAVLLAQLVREVERALDIDNLQCYAWTDSTIVLSWLQSNPNRWKAFVGNRVAEIQAVIKPDRWSHVSSKNNPADVASRGTFPSALLKDTLWWEGPKWLKDPTFKFSKPHVQETELELNTKFITHTAVTEQPYVLLEDVLQRYSSLKKLQRILAYCIRFIINSKRKMHERITGPITAAEIATTIRPLVMATQYKQFREEIERLSNKKQLSKTSRLLPLNPFLDKHNLLRVGGRLEESNLAFDQKHPIILPYKSELTSLVINNAHLTTLHGGPSKTLEYIRQRFWILNGLKSVKCHIHPCVTCHRFNAASANQLMGNLPKPRLQVTRPFTHSGVDYAGPVTLRLSKGRGTKTYKGYIALFICLSTKAIHLEVVSDLTSQAFLAAFKRFVSRRGPVSHIYSDNATNFVGASKVLADIFNTPSYRNEILQAMANDGVEWHFIPPASPHFGGLWEAGIKATKHHMKRVIGETVLTFEELATLMTMIEACLNSRPLCPLTNDPGSLEVLTPGHFLIGSPLLSAPQESTLDVNPNLLTRWCLLDRMHQEFWKQWSSEYLSRLQQRPKWAQSQINVKPGNIVLLKEDNLPPTRWALARVLEVHPGNDGLVRVVTLKTSTTTIKRAITKIALLPIVDNNPESISNNAQQPEQQTTGTPIRPEDLDHNIRPIAHTAKRKQRDAIKKTDAKRSRSTATNFSAMIFTLAFGLLLALVGGEPISQSYNNMPFNNNQGIYFEAVTDANIYNNEWTLVVHYELSGYINQLNMLKTAILQLNTVCETVREDDPFKRHCTATLTQLNHQLNEVEDANQLLYQHNGHPSLRRRRAPLFGFVGRIASSLFGVLDQEFAENYENQILQLKENENHMKELLQKQTSIADSTVNLIKRGQEDIRKQFLAVKRHVTELQEELNKGQQELNLQEGFNAATLLISLDITSIRHIQQAMLSVLTDSRYGKISTILLTPTQLTTQLQLIRQHLPRDLLIPEEQKGNVLLTLYSLMQIKARVTARNVICEIKLPLVNAEYYKIYHLIPIPMIHSNKLVYVQPSSKYLLVNTHRDRYCPMDDNDLALCRQWNDDHLLCKLIQPMYNLRANASKCEIELLTLTGKLSTYCNMKTSPVKMTWLKMHNPNSWLYVMDQETTFDVICGHDSEQVNLRNSGIFQLQAGCLLKHSSMYLTATNKLTENITSSFLIETSIPIPILHSLNKTRGNNSSEDLPPIHNDISSKDIEDLQSMIDSQQRELNNFKNLNIHNAHHYTVTYVIITAGIILTFVYYWRKRRTMITQTTKSNQAGPSASEKIEISTIPNPRPRQHLFGY